MTDHPTSDEVRASIKPKSDQLNADDLLLGPITVTITNVRRGNKEQPIIVEIEGYQPYKPCKTCRRCLIAIWSDDPKKWIGQQITLFTDPSVLYGGVAVGGLRISHMSGIDEPRTFMLTKTRGKKVEVTIRPIKQPSVVTEAQVDGLKKPWDKKLAEVTASMDKDGKRTAFQRWVNDTVGRDVDVGDFRKWTADDLKKCEEALG